MFLSIYSFGASRCATFCYGSTIGDDFALESQHVIEECKERVDIYSRIVIHFTTKLLTLIFILFH